MSEYFNNLFKLESSCQYSGETIYKSFRIPILQLQRVNVEIETFRAREHILGFTLGTPGTYRFLEDGRLAGQTFPGVAGFFTDTSPRGKILLEFRSKNGQLNILPHFFDPKEGVEEPRYRQESGWDAMKVEQLSETKWRFYGNHYEDRTFRDIVFTIELLPTEQPPPKKPRAKKAPKPE
ncbi:MAG: hypothetical protein SFX74_07475 [Fimbriimonadaceae bacterium]|nr:hypothetical protein [Fimbriimonadaceae bacterium]